MFEVTGRKNKDELRSAALHFLKGNRGAAKNFLDLPAEKAVSLAEAKTIGLVNNQTNCVLVESRKIKPIIENKCDKLGIEKRQVFNCLLQDILPAQIPPLDAAFFDFCGPLSQSLFRWIGRTFSEEGRLSNNARFAFTFCLNQRGEGVSEWIDDALEFIAHFDTKCQMFDGKSIRKGSLNYIEGNKFSENLCDTVLLLLMAFYSQNMQVVSTRIYFDRSPSNQMGAIFMQRLNKPLPKVIASLRQTVFERCFQLCELHNAA